MHGFIDAGVSVNVQAGGFESYVARGHPQPQRLQLQAPGRCVHVGAQVSDMQPALLLHTERFEQYVVLAFGHMAHITVHLQVAHCHMGCIKTLAAARLGKHIVG